MSDNIQTKKSYRQVGTYDVGETGHLEFDLPSHRAVDKAFKEWEIRRGFRDKNEKIILRGRPLLFGKLAQNRAAAAKKKTAKKKVTKKKK